MPCGKGVFQVVLGSSVDREPHSFFSSKAKVCVYGRGSLPLPQLDVKQIMYHTLDLRCIHHSHSHSSKSDLGKLVMRSRSLGTLENSSLMASSSSAASEAKIVAKGMPQVRWSREGSESYALGRSSWTTYHAGLSSLAHPSHVLVCCLVAVLNTHRCTLRPVTSTQLHASSNHSVGSMHNPALVVPFFFCRTCPLRPSIASLYPSDELLLLPPNLIHAYATQRMRCCARRSGCSRGGYVCFMHRHGMPCLYAVLQSGGCHYQMRYCSTSCQRNAAPRLSPRNAIGPPGEQGY